MKSVYTLAALSLICLGLGYGGKLFINRLFNNSSRTTVTYTEDKISCRLTATYPIYTSKVVGDYLKAWADKAVFRSGSFTDKLVLKFTGGGSCTVHTNGRDLEIVAARNQNDSTSLASIKTAYKSIKDFIVQQASSTQEQ